jgi:type IV fimbrial biogenesis protein FimT
MVLSVKRASRTIPAFSSDGRAAKGFTLIELMIVLVIVAVVLMIAAPSYSVLSLRTKLKSYANEVVASAYLARSEAIKRNAPMRFCISTDGSSCAGAGDWDQGWVVMDPNDTVIKYQQALSGIKVFEVGGADTVTFQPSGITSTPVTLTICQQVPSEGIEEREVRITPTGRPTVKTTKAGCGP